jgi:hypothetical protein
VLVRWVIPIAIGVILVLGIRDKLDVAGSAMVADTAAPETAGR